MLLNSGGQPDSRADLVRMRSHAAFSKDAVETKLRTGGDDFGEGRNTSRFVAVSNGQSRDRRALIALRATDQHHDEGCRSRCLASRMAATVLLLTQADQCESADLRDSDGSSLILHMNPDNPPGDQTGNAGDRIACAVI